MSWVTDVILIFGVGEEYDEKEDLIEPVPALENINAWLEQGDYGQLLNIGAEAGGDKFMQANVYGGAFNFLKIDEFIQMVREQPWREPENVQLLIQDEDETRFTLHTIASE